MTQETIARKMEALAAALPARTSLLWQGMEEDAPRAAFEPEKKMVSASTIKTPLMMALFQQVLEGKCSLADRIHVTQDMILEDSRYFEQGPGEYPLEELVRFMITTSDNSCTNIIIDLLTFEGANAYFASLGLTETRLERHMLDYDAIDRGYNNYTSARDEYKVYRALYRHEVLTDDLCELALSILKDNRDYALFYRYLPQNIEMAHKSGGLDGLTHDNGILYLGEQPSYLGVFVSGMEDESIGPKLMGTVARMIWDLEGLPCKR